MNIHEIFAAGHRATNQSKVMKSTNNIPLKQGCSQDFSRGSIKLATGQGVKIQSTYLL
jgi:predicted rRNA methylase YqxC with S4 and FtsJ domains